MRKKTRIPLLGSGKPVLAVLAIAVLFVSLSAALLQPARQATAAANSYINFQARLMNGQGAIVPDGYYNVEFKIFNASTSSGSSQGSCTGDANCLWTETYYDTNGVTAGNDFRVRVANGYLTVSLGSRTAFPSTINWDQQLWITMNIGGTTQTATPTYDGEMSPRLQLTAVPYAFRASRLAETVGSGTGVLKFGTLGQDSTITLPDPGVSGTATVCYQSSTSCGFATGTSGSYIQNGTSIQTNANYAIRSAATGSVGAVIQGASGQTADLLQLQSWNGSSATTVFSVNNNGVLSLAGGQTADITTLTGNLTIAPGGSNTTLTLNANGTGSLSVGTNATNKTINIGAVGSTAGSTTLHIADTTDTGTTQAITIGSVGNASNAVTIRSGTTGGINLGAIGSATNGSTIHIADTTDATGAQLVTIGSSAANSSSRTLIQGGSSTTAGSEAIRLLPGTAGSIAIGATNGTGTITLGQSTAANTINIGNADFTAANTQTINIANGAQTTAASTLSVNILSGAAGNSGTATLNLGNSDRVTGVNIGNVAADAARTLNLFSGSNTVAVDTLNIGTGDTTVASGKTIHIGDGAPSGSGTNVITVGSIAGVANTTTIQGGNGTGAVSIQAATSGTISIGTSNNNPVTIGNTSATGQLTLGQSGATNTVSIASANQTSGTPTQTISIGNGDQSVAGSIAVNILSSATNNSAGTGTLKLGNSDRVTQIDVGNVTADASRTLNLFSGNTINTMTDTINIGTGNSAGNGAKVVHIADGSPGGTGTNTVTIGSITGTGNVTTIQGGNGTGAISVQAASSGTITIGTTNSNTITLGGASSVVKLGALGSSTTTAIALCRDSSNGNLIACDSGTANGTPFLQGGNSFGTTAVLGTKDAQNLQIITGASSTIRATFDQSNNLYLGNGATATTPNNFGVVATGSLTAGTAGATLTIQGGAGSSATTGSAGGGVSLRSGNAGGTGDNNGGTVLIQGGSATGAGVVGTVTIQATGGTVGIGTSTPDTSSKLEVSGSISTPLASAAYRTYENVVGYSSNSAGVTGTMKITMPLTWNSTMMRMTIKGYNWTSTTGAWEVVVSGYNYLVTPAWLNTTVEFRGRAPFNSVRLGYDGSKMVVLLGTTSSTWEFPKITVSEFTSGYNGASGAWGSGWAIAPIVSETGITNIVTPSVQMYMNTSGFLGIGNANPSALLSVGSSSQFQVDGTGAVTAVGVNSGTGLIQGSGGLTLTGGALTVTGGLAADITTASAGAAAAMTVQPGVSTGSNGTGGALTLKAGDENSTTCGTACAGGTITIQGGSATGASGTTRNGGSVSIDAGTGATANGSITIGGTNATGVTIGKTAGTVTLQGTIKVGTALSTSTNPAVALCRDGTTTNIVSCATSTGTGAPFVQGGNAFGATAVLGTTDAFNLQVITGASSTVRATFDQSNGLYLGNGVTANTPNDFTVSGTGSGTAGTAGATLTLKGGAGASATTGSIGGDIKIQGGAAGGSGNNNGGNVLLQGGLPANSGTTGGVIVRNPGDIVNAFQVQNAAASSTIMNVDTLNGRVGIGGTATVSKLEVLNGDAAIYNNGLSPKLILGDSTSGGQNGYLQWDSTNDYFRIETVGTNGLKVKDNFVAIGNIFPSQPLIVGNGATNLFQIDTFGVATMIGGQTADITSAVTSGAATALTLQPGITSTANGTGAVLTFKAGDESSTTCGTACTGGTVTIQGGSATGGSGTTRNGGSVTIDAGTGATANGSITIGGTNATGVTIGKATGTVTLQGTAKLATALTTSTNAAVTLCRDGTTTNIVSCATSTGNGVAFVQGGNAFGAPAVLGTTDAQNLQIITGSSGPNVRATFDQSNNLYLGNGVTATSPNNFAVQATGSGATSAAGATLTLQGGAGWTGTTGSAGGVLKLQGGNAAGSGNNAGGNIQLNPGTKINSGTPGIVLVQPAATGNDSTALFSVKNFAGGNVFTVDTVNGRLGVGLGSNNVPTMFAGQGIEIADGSLRFSSNSGSNKDHYTSPGGASVGSLINVVNYDPGSNSQIIAFGLPSGTVNANTRAISVFDARAGSHQPTISLFSVDENSVFGFSWDGSSTTARLKTDGVQASQPSILIKPADSTAGTAGSSTLNGGDVSGTTGVTGGAAIIQGGNAAGASGTRTGGAVTIDGGTGATAAGAINIGTSNSTSINIGSVGSTAKATTIAIGTTSNGSNTQAITIGSNGTSSNAVTIDGGTIASAIQIGNSATAHGIQIGTGAAAQTITMGSTNGASSLLLQTGSGNLIAKIGTDGANAFQVQNAGGATQLSLDTSNTSSSLNLAATNGGAETSGTFTTQWPAAGLGTGVTVSRDTTAGEYASGTAGVKVISTTGASSGAQYNLPGGALTTSTTYIVSFDAMLAPGGTPSTFTDLDVRYNRTGTTQDALCTTGSAQTSGTSTMSTRTLTASVWTKITCSFVTSTTGGTGTANLAIIQTAAATTRTWYIDNLSIVTQNSSGTQNVGTLRVGGANSQGLTLFTLDTYAATPFSGANASLAGSMYFDTTQGKIQCYDGTLWGACGAAPNSNITLTPEYAGAVLHGTGIGTLTSDFCGNGGGLSVNTSICASGEARNYYNWTSVQASSQSYSMYVTYKLPSTFKAFVNGTTTVTARTDNTSNASASYKILKSTGSTITSCSASTDIVGGTSGATVNTWTPRAPATDPSTCSFAANNYVIIEIDVNASNSANVQVENLNFSFSNQ